MSSRRARQVRGPSLPVLGRGPTMIGSDRHLRPRTTAALTGMAVGLALLSGCGDSTPATSATDTAEAVGDGQDTAAPARASEGDQNFLVDGYPLDTVPLHELKAIQSSSFYVNTEPEDGYSGNGRTYYNVVFRTAASQSELLDHYASLFDEVDADLSSETNLVGTIGDLDVAASHYGEGDSAYLQVYLPADQESTFDDAHFSGFPMTFEPTAGMDQREAAITLIDQLGGEVRHHVYYAITDPTTATFTELEDHYEQRYGDATGFSFDRESGDMRWEEQGYEVVLNFTQDQGRVYLQTIEAM